MHFAVGMSSVHHVSKEVYELFNGGKIAWGR